MKRIMEKSITKRLEKFVSNAQNHIFASRFRDKLKASELSLGIYVETGLKKVAIKYRKAYKFAWGKERVKKFLMNNISSFERDHQRIVNMIEYGDVKENFNSYLQCKNRISAVIKATRRLSSLKVTDNETITSYLNERINRKRFSSKFELAT